jgi:Uma2 family endonuclease
MDVIAKPTREEFKRLIENPANDDRRLELFDGEIYEKSRYAQRSLVVGAIGAQFFTYLQAHPIGYSMTTVHIELPNDDNMPLIDLAVSLHDQTEIDWNDYPHVCPEIIVEVEYKGQSAHLLARKAQYYLAHECRMVVLLYPQQRIAEVLTPASRQLLTTADTLDFNDILPGLSIPVVSIFPPIIN